MLTGKHFYIVTLLIFSRFRVVGSVTFKEDPRNINTKRGQSKVFSFTLTDTLGNSIKVTGFGRECDRFADLVQEGQVILRIFTNLINIRPITSHVSDLTLCVRQTNALIRLVTRMRLALTANVTSNCVRIEIWEFQLVN